MDGYILSPLFLVILWRVLFGKSVHACLSSAWSLVIVNIFVTSEEESHGKQSYLWVLPTFYYLFTSLLVLIYPPPKTLLFVFL